jgi:hypothetical protein
LFQKSCSLKGVYNDNKKNMSNMLLIMEKYGK